MLRYQRSAILSCAATMLLGAVSGFVGNASIAAEPGTMLSGSQEVPPTGSAATGTSSIVVAADRSVSGTVVTTGIDSTVAHIHQGAPGVNGAVLIPLTRTSPTLWTVPAGSRLTPAQYASYLAGDLYVNVYSAAHPGGEIRLQLH